MNYILQVRYINKKDFLWYSPCFIADSLDDAIHKAPEIITEEWAKISPHPPPTEIVDVIAGTMGIHDK